MNNYKPKTKYKMKKQQFYAVRKGRSGPKIHLNWNDCEKDVKGYPGNQYEAFDTMDEARQWLNEASKGKLPVVNPGVFPDNTAVYIYLPEGEFEQEYKMQLRNLANHKVVMAHLIYAKDRETAEFLSLITALEFCKSKRMENLIYTQSRAAIGAARHPSEVSQDDSKAVADAKEWIRSNNGLNACVAWPTEWGDITGYLH